LPSGRVDLGSADDEAAAAAAADPLSVDKRARTQEIDRSAEPFGKEVRCNAIARLSFALAPKGRSMAIATNPC